MKHLIKIVKGEPVVSTEVIAAEFGRRHDNVMQNIRSLIESDHLGPLDFKESSYVNKQNKVQPCYELTERGFLIAMPLVVQRIHEADCCFCCGPAGGRTGLDC